MTFNGAYHPEPYWWNFWIFWALHPDMLTVLLDHDTRTALHYRQ